MVQAPAAGAARRDAAPHVRQPADASAHQPIVELLPPRQIPQRLAGQCVCSVPVTPLRVFAYAI